MQRWHIKIRISSNKSLENHRMKKSSRNRRNTWKVRLAEWDTARKEKRLLLSEHKILMLLLYFQRITDCFKVKTEALTFIESNCKAQYAYFYGLRDWLCLPRADLCPGSSCLGYLLHQQRKQEFLLLNCSEGIRVFPLNNSAHYKVKGEVRVDWKGGIHPVHRVVFLGHLQSQAFYRGGMTMTDVCRKII